MSRTTEVFVIILKKPEIREKLIEWFIKNNNALLKIGKNFRIAEITVYEGKSPERMGVCITYEEGGKPKEFLEKILNAKKIEYNFWGLY